MTANLEIPRTSLATHLNSAEICRRNGWGIGRQLFGEPLPKSEDQQRITIIITDVRQTVILARQVIGGFMVGQLAEEAVWDLHTRDWSTI